MSGVKGFLRRMSFKEPKKTQSKSASTGHLEQKFRTQQQQQPNVEDNIPYCLRQLQLEANSNNNNNYKELSKSHNHVSGRGTKQGTTYINNLGSDHHHRHHHHNGLSPQYLSLKSVKHTDNDSNLNSDRCLTLQYRPRYQSSSNFSNTRCPKHRDGSDIIIRNPSTSLQNLNPKVANAESRFKNVNSLLNEDGVRRWIFEDVFLCKTRQGQGLGFTVAGGRDAPGGVHIDSQRSVFVQRIISGGLAMEDGRLRPRDIMVSVNGVHVKGSTHIHVVELLKNSGSQVQLKVKRLPNMHGQFIEVSLKKESTSKGLGFSITGGVGSPEVADDDGIFVSQIFPDGVAHEDGRMKSGDKILFVDDLDMTGRTHDGAVNILKSSTFNKNLVTIQLLRRYDRHHHRNHHQQQQQQQQQQSISNINHDNNNRIPDEAIYSKVKKKELRISAPLPTNQEPGVHSPPGSNRLHKPRRVIIRRGASTRGLGINIVGGVGGQGLFVNYLIPGSPASEQTDLRRGDKLLRVNHVDLRGVSHEEAVAALKNSGDYIVIIAHYKSEELDRLERWISELKEKEKHGSGEEDDDDELHIQVLPSPDDIYLRSLFDYDPFLDVTFSPFDPAPIERLKVKFGDVFRIPRKGLNEQWCQATKVFSTENYSNNKSNTHDAGFIPGILNPLLKTQSLQSNEQRRNSTEFRTSKKRRSFIFSSKLKPSGKTGDRKLASNILSSSYEPVTLRQCLGVRPLLIVGSLKDRMNDLLTSKYPQLFESCVPHTTRPMRRGEVSGREYVFVLTREEMEEEMERGEFVEVGVYKNHYYGVSYQSIRNISNQNKHCLLDLSIESLVRLHTVDIFPVVILLRSTSNNLISSWLQTNDETRLRSFVEQTEQLLQRHKHMFSAVVEGTTEEDLYHGVLRTVENHGTKFMWVPSDEKGF